MAPTNSNTNTTTTTNAANVPTLPAKATKAQCAKLAKAHGLSMAGTKGLTLAQLRAYVAWGLGQRANGVQTAVNVRLFSNATKAAKQAKAAKATKAKAAKAAKVQAATVAAQVQGFVAVFSQGLGVRVPAPLAQPTTKALEAAGYVVAGKQLANGSHKLTAAGGRRRSRSQYEAVIAALWAAGTQHGKSSRARAIGRPAYLQVVGNTADFLACGWAANAANGLVKAARRLGYAATYTKGATKAADMLVLVAPAKGKAASKAS